MVKARKDWRRSPVSGRLALAYLLGGREGLRRELRRRIPMEVTPEPIEVYSEELLTEVRGVLEEN